VLTGNYNDSKIKPPACLAAPAGNPHDSGRSAPVPAADYQRNTLWMLLRAIPHL